MSGLLDECKKIEALRGAKFLHAYIECSDEIQEGIRRMLKIVFDPESDKDDAEMALFTVADMLFPQPHNGILGMDLVESEQMGSETPAAW